MIAPNWGRSVAVNMPACQAGDREFSFRPRGARSSSVSPVGVIRSVMLILPRGQHNPRRSRSRDKTIPVC